MCKKNGAAKATNFANIDLNALFERVRKNLATYEERVIFASFNGTWLRNWRDKKALIEKGLLNPTYFEMAEPEGSDS